MNTVINYSLQNEETQQHYVYELPSNKLGVTLKDVCQSFPVPGKFHFRFKTYLSEIQGSGWLDVSNLEVKVP
jgi:hypothetical protein